MLFKKPLSEVEFSDIQKLKDNKIEESLILDYKKEMISDEKTVKHIAAFSNTNGGFLVFGVEETGRGGYPKDIPGIEASVNVERLEQIIISNIRPRIGVQTCLVGMMKLISNFLSENHCTGKYEINPHPDGSFR